MAKLNAQDASFLALETTGAPMHIGFLLTFKLPAGASADYLQKLHAKLARFPVDAAPFNMRLKHKEGWSQLRPEWEVDDAVDLEYHLRHEALPWPGGERELGLAISRLHTLPLERSRPLWECTLIEGLQPRRFALYIKIHHALADGVGMMNQLSRALAESPRGASLPLWSASVTPPPPDKDTQAVDEDWRRFFEGLLEGMGKPKSARKPSSGIPRGPRCILNGDTTGRRRFATQRLELARIKAVAETAEATVNDAVLAVCSGALRAYLEEFDRIPRDSLIVSVPVALPRERGQTIGNAVAGVHASLATQIADPKKRLLAIRDSMREAKDEFKRLPASLSRAINSLGMLAMMMVPKHDNPDPENAAFSNLTISNVPGPKKKLYFHGAEMDGMYPVSVLTGDHRLNITVLGYHEGLHFGFTACPDTLPSVQKLALQLEPALRDLERAVGVGRAARPAR